MAKKKKTEEQPSLDFPGIDWNHSDLGISDLLPSALRRVRPVKLLPLGQRVWESDQEDKKPKNGTVGYHATDSTNIESIKKSGIQSGNPLDGYSDEDLKDLGIDRTLHHGVFFHEFPHVGDYGDAVFKINIPKNVEVYDSESRADNEGLVRGGEGHNVTRDVPASWISLYGHTGPTGKFHKTAANPQTGECAECKVEHLWLEDMAKRKLGEQFQ